MLNDEIRERIRILREDRGISQKDFAKMVGKAPSKLSELETGRKKGSIHLDDLPVFAEALGVSKYYLLMGTEDKNYNAAEDLGLHDDTIERIRKMNPKQKALLELLINDDGSVTDPALDPDYGFMDALSNYACDPDGNRIVELLDDFSSADGEQKYRLAPLKLRIRLSDGTFHAVYEWKPDRESVMNRLAIIRKKYLDSPKPWLYSPVIEEDDDE